jgi:hypothetical protein
VTNFKRLALGVALAGIVSGAGAGSALALEGQAEAPIAGDCGGSVYWNTSSNPILTASVNNPSGCTKRITDAIEFDVNEDFLDDLIARPVP